MSKDILTKIVAPENVRYLSDVFLEGLPENCMFDKVLTGCGGTFVAIKSVGLKTICSLYDKNPKECEEKFPEWVPIIETLGTLTICNLGYSKTEAKLLFESRTKGSSAMEVETLHSLLKIGQAYTKDQLTEVFAEAGASKAK